MIPLSNKLIQYSVNKKEIKGFTLIELLVVVILIGILSAISLPSLLNQVEKAREAEAKNNLGAINRAQQAYRFEKAVFATSLEDLGLNLTVGYYNSSNYQTEVYSYSVQGTPTASEAHHLAAPQLTYTNEIKSIASAIFISGGTIKSVLCQADNPSVTPVIVNTMTCNNGEILR